MGNGDCALCSALLVATACYRRIDIGSVSSHITFAHMIYIFLECIQLTLNKILWVDVRGTEDTLFLGIARIKLHRVIQNDGIYSKLSKSFQRIRMSLFGGALNNLHIPSIGGMKKQFNKVLFLFMWTQKDGIAIIAD